MAAPNRRPHLVRVISPEDLIVIKALVHDEETPRHWHDALGREAPESGCPDVYVAEALRSALARDPRVHELGLTVRLVAGKLFLAGVVASTERRECIAAVARELLPGFDIHNEVSVEPMSPPERETLA